MQRDRRKMFAVKERAREGWAFMIDVYGFNIAWTAFLGLGLGFLVVY